MNCWTSCPAPVVLMIPAPTILRTLSVFPTAASGWLRLPFPTSDSSCGLPEILSVKARLANRGPPAVGANRRLTWHVSPVATLVQVLEILRKSPALAPVMVTLLITSGAVPQLVMVTLVTRLVIPTPTLLKSTVLPPKQIAGNSAVPTPVRGSVVKPPAASSAITRVADRPPVARGANATLIVQVPPTASGPPVQLCVTKKSFDAKPVGVTLEMFKTAEPQFVIVILCTALVVVSNWPPKLSVPAPELRQMIGAAGVAVPLSGTMRGLPVALSVKTRFA